MWYKPEKPKRPYKSLQAYRIARCNHKKDLIESPDKWPCLNCRAAGWIHDPDDPPDIIEGYKLVRRIKCPRCDGTCIGTRDQCNVAYKTEMQKYRQRLLEYSTRALIRNKALRKLTREEIKALDIHQEDSDDKKIWKG